MRSFILTVCLVAGLAVPAHGGQLGDTFSDMNYVFKTGILQGMVAKEMCSCRYVARLSLEDCKALSPLPSILFSLITIDDSQKGSITVIVQPGLVTGSTSGWARAVMLDHRRGCLLIANHVR